MLRWILVTSSLLSLFGCSAWNNDSTHAAPITDPAKAIVITDHGTPGACPCGPTCACAATANNTACRCPKCDECGRCVCQCQCNAKPPLPDPKPVPAEQQISEAKPDPPGDYESHRIRLRLVTTDWCPACVQVKRFTLPPLEKAGWKVGSGAANHVEVIKNGGGTIPRWERVVDGHIVATITGYLDPRGVDRFLTGGNEPKRRELTRATQSGNLSAIGAAIDSTAGVGGAASSSAPYAGVLPELHSVRDSVKLLRAALSTGLNLGEYGQLRAKPGTTLTLTTNGQAVIVSCNPAVEVTLKKWGVSHRTGLTGINLTDNKMALSLKGFPDLTFDVVD